MSVNIVYEEQNQGLNDDLYYLQIISDAFTSALDSNQCNVKIIVGLAYEIEDAAESLKDTYNYADNPISGLPVTDQPSTTTTLDDVINQAVSTPSTTADVQSIAKALKDSCIDCKLSFPTLDLNANLSYSFDKLQALLSLFTDTFKTLLNPNLCHVAGTMSYACIPSILALIVLLLEAYATILALRKIGSISLSAFIKGIITGLIGTLLSSISIKLDTSKTGIKCLIDAIKEIADQLQSEVDSVTTDVIPTEALAKLGLSSKDYTTTTDTEEEEKDSISTLISELEEEKSSWSKDSFDKAYNSLDTAKQKYIDNYLNNLESQTDKAEKAVSAAFTEVANTLETMMKNFKDTIEGLFGLLDYFKCEAERSGTGMADLLYDMNKILQLVNLLSAILSIVAKKQVKKLCSTKQSINQMITTITTEDLVGDPLTELEQVEVIAEYLGKVVEVTTDSNGNITPIIYEKDAETILPKLSFSNCDLKSVMEAHSLENVIKAVLKEIDKENNNTSTNLDSIKNNNGTSIKVSTNTKVILPNEYVVDKDTWEKYPIKFETFTPNKDTPENLTKDVEGILNSNVGISDSIQSIIDLIYNNPLDKKVTETSKGTTSTTDAGTTENIPNYKTALKNSVATSSNMDKKAFSARCRDIDDVLNKLKDL